MSITSIPQFVEACRELNSDEIYELFEYQITWKLREEIYAITAETRSPEPVRLRLNMLGKQYDIESLKAY